MSKKPFSIRVEQTVSNKFKALSSVLNVDSATLFSQLISEKESKLTDDERKAYEALLVVWKDD
ncbi:hypothetical protein [Bacillus kwashiorkori]|uniref:hypothetical protein n=1 Tax=Bacillus kwashiorkori TaxID=1522318 RepID=UPI000785019B|nr:hypothetical protein [Bacillus kwashiorkori]